MFEVSERQKRVLRELDFNIDALNVVNLLSSLTEAPRPQKRKRGKWIDDRYTDGDLLDYDMLLAAEKATGIFTMLSTELLACVNHFTCSENFPTLSYAATFRPEAFAFTGGMCLTAIFIFTLVVLFFWYLQLRMQRNSDERENTPKQVTTGYASRVGSDGIHLALRLAVMDMRNYHDAHVSFTIVFFIAAWAMMIAVQIARKNILHEDESVEKSFSTDSLLVTLQRRSFWLSVRRWRRLDAFTAYTLGRLLLNTGLASTFLFALFFLCANGVWPNPLGFTAVQEAFFEALAIVCQLLFMGTLSCELARLARLVERSDYAELERNE
ncbi:Frag1/DRAM/Sfk1 [Phytophthora cactorum]|nr:Frag1/DRAM/Sfk1 [Phytophthora cactorum]